MYAAAGVDHMNNEFIHGLKRSDERQSASGGVVGVTRRGGSGVGERRSGGKWLITSFSNNTGTWQAGQSRAVTVLLRRIKHERYPL